MAEYCITAANHKNQNNHCASSFFLWKLNTDTLKWDPLGAKSLSYVSDLLAAGHKVLSAQHDAKKQKLYFGAPVEVELRIAKNETNYKLTEMPTF